MLNNVYNHRIIIFINTCSPCYKHIRTFQFCSLALLLQKQFSQFALSTVRRLLLLSLLLLRTAACYCRCCFAQSSALLSAGQAQIRALYVCTLCTHTHATRPHFFSFALSCTGNTKNDHVYDVIITWISYRVNLNFEIKLLQLIKCHSNWSEFVVSLSKYEMNYGTYLLIYFLFVL